MSRLKRFTHSLASGYLLLACNVVYTIASARVAVHYLTNNEFGLWSVVTQVSSYLLLIDLGMSGSVSRILVDHKDDRTSGAYGSVIQTGVLVLLVQGLAIALVGAAVSYWLPFIMNLGPEYRAISQKLMAWQCATLALSFIGRIFGHILQAHQRFDIQNYGQIGMLGIGFIMLWVGFENGMGLYSQILANAFGFVFNICFLLVAVVKTNVLPAAGNWGRPKWKIFKELFSYGNDLFLLSVGLQLMTASQSMVLARALGPSGLEAAAVWSNMTKAFMLGQQFIGKIFDFSAGALSEMFVRGESDTLQKRFRDITILTAAMSVLSGAGLAACNDAFVNLWLKGRFGWDSINNWLMAILLVVGCVSRCHVALLGQTKDIGGMRYVYFLEGICFVVAAYLLAPHYGFKAVIVAAIISNLCWSGAYGIKRTAKRFSISGANVAFDWMKNAFSLLCLLWPLALSLWFVTRSLSTITVISINGAILICVGGLLFYRFGLPRELRTEAQKSVMRFVGRNAAKP